MMMDTPAFETLLEESDWLSPQRSSRSTCRYLPAVGESTPTVSAMSPTLVEPAATAARIEL